MTEESFGTRVGFFREKSGKTLEELAKKVGSTKSYMWELENKPGIRPSAELAYKLAEALDTSVEELLGAKTAMPADQVFFREYKKLTPSHKAMLQKIAKSLKDET